MMTEETNMHWGADEIEKVMPAQEIIDAATAQFIEMTGFEPVSNKQLLDFFIGDVDVDEVMA